MTKKFLDVLGVDVTAEQQRSARVPEVVEADRGGQTCAPQHGLERAHDVAVRERRSHAGGEDQAMILPEAGAGYALLQLAHAVLLKSGDASGAEVYPSTAPLRLRRGELAVGKSAVHVQDNPVQVHVFPPQGEKLARPEPGVHSHDIQGLESLSAGSIQEPAGLLGRKRVHLLLPHLRHVYGVADVARNHAPPHGLLERPVQYGVRVLNGPRREPAILHLPVESLNVRRSESVEPHASNSRDYVASRLAIIGLIGAPPDAALYGIVKPAVQVLGHGEPRSVEDQALVRSGAGFPQRLARLLFSLARHVASLPVRAEVRASVGGYLTRLVLAREHIPVTVRPALRLTHGRPPSLRALRAQRSGP